MGGREEGSKEARKEDKKETRKGGNKEGNKGTRNCKNEGTHTQTNKETSKGGKKETNKGTKEKGMQELTKQRTNEQMRTVLAPSCSTVRGSRECNIISVRVKGGGGSRCSI